MHCAFAFGSGSAKRVEITQHFEDKIEMKKIGSRKRSLELKLSVYPKA